LNPLTPGRPRGCSPESSAITADPATSSTAFTAPPDLSDLRGVGGTAWAQQMTRYLANVGKTPADLYYAQVWDPSGALGLDAGVFQAAGISAASLRKAIISSSRTDSPDLSVSDASLSGKHVTVVVNQASGTTLYLYDHRDDVFYTGGSGPSAAAQFLGQLP
jgi:hypothetical protein